MPFSNRIRLPFYVSRPQFPAERNQDRLADGTIRTKSVIIRKQYEGETDYLPEDWHQKLAIAFNHDIVNIESDKYIGGLAMDSDYDIEWIRFLDYPIAKAGFKVQVTPFNFTNSNCMTCEQAAQLEAVDDVFDDMYNQPIDLEENTEYEKNVASNDDICCSPTVFELIYFNTYYLDAADIDENGILSVLTGTGLISANNILLATYRVTCPDGSYDEADVYGNISGSIAGCLTPEDLEIIDITTSSAVAQWNEPSPAPNLYSWQLYLASNLGAPVATGAEAGGGGSPIQVSDLVGLDPNTDYVFMVQSECDESDTAWLEIEFHTLAESATCGKYEVEYDDGTGDRTNFGDVSYIDCNSDPQTVRIPNQQTRIICALQNSPGDPVQIIGATLITYIEPC